jgi:hypothetical protein
MALSVLYFADGDPVAAVHGTSSAPSAADAAASRAAYDVRHVVPCAAALSRAGALSPAVVSASGWLPLLLRSLASRDDAVRCRPLVTSLSPLCRLFAASAASLPPLCRPQQDRDARCPVVSPCSVVRCGVCITCQQFVNA